MILLQPGVAQVLLGALQTGGSDEGEDKDGERRPLSGTPSSPSRAGGTGSPESLGPYPNCLQSNTPRNTGEEDIITLKNEAG